MKPVENTKPYSLSTADRWSSLENIGISLSSGFTLYIYIEKSHKRV